MTDSLPAPAPSTAVAATTTDAQLVQLWLGKVTESEHTRRAYHADTDAFRDFVDKPIREVQLNDAFAWSLALTGSAATRQRKLAAVRSLFSFAVSIGYLPFNVLAAVKSPRTSPQINQRVLTVLEVLRLIESEPDGDVRLLLAVLYYSGARASEAARLRWRDVIEREEGRGQLQLHGKGGKVRNVPIPAFLFRLLQSQRGEPDEAVLRGASGRPLSYHAIYRRVRRAGERIGKPLTPHWLRHSNATHALAAKAPLHVVQSTLGHASIATTGVYLHARPEDSSALYLEEMPVAVDPTEEP